MLTLRNYQKVGVEFLTKNKRVMLCDAPGLGKTIQLIRAAKKPVIVSCPTYLMLQWEKAIRSEYPKDMIIVATGPRIRREACLSMPFDWLIVNHQMFQSRKVSETFITSDTSEIIKRISYRKNQRVIEHYVRYKFPIVKTLIIDESHHMRTHTSSQAKNVAEFSKTCEYVFLATATPIFKSVDDLYMQLHIVAPQIFNSYWKFVNNYCNIQRTPWALRILGFKDYTKKQLIRHIKPYLLGRKYSQVNLELPEIIHKSVIIEMSPELKSLYNKVRSGYNLLDETDLNPLGVIRQLRMLTNCKEKLKSLIDLLDDIGPSVIFTWYKDSALNISELLKCPVIVGDIPAEFRKQQVVANKHIVATISSLSEGVDLSQYHNVIFYETHYSPGAMYQAQSRVHRFGATQPVLCYYMIMEKSIDQIIFNVLQDRTITEQEIMRMALQQDI